VLLDYWRQQLDGAPHVLHLPIDHERPEDQTFNGTVLGFRFDDELSAKVIEFSRQHKVTVFTVLLACYFALLYRYSGQEDMLVGAPVANRGHPDLEPIIGLFVNTLVLRARLHEDVVFSELLDDVRTVTLGAYEHQSLPFERLVDELRVDRLPGFAPLYQVVFNFQNAALIESAAPSAEGEVMEQGDFPFVHSSTAKVDINLTVTLNDASISGGIEYNTDLFEPTSIEAMIARYRTIVSAVMRDPSLAVLEIPLLADSEDSAARGAASSPGTAAEASDFLSAGRFDFEFDHGDVDHGALA
jgi:non-ribosomal peptide synthetase component F